MRPLSACLHRCESLECSAMETSDRKPGKPELPRLTLQQRRELHRLYRQCPRPSSAFLQNIAKVSPALADLDIYFLRAWFRGRRYKEKIDGKLYPLISMNTELKAEHKSLLLLNNQLKSQALLLNLENQCLKKELEKQLESKQGTEVAEEACSIDTPDSISEPCESAICGLESDLQAVKLHE